MAGFIARPTKTNPHFSRVHLYDGNRAFDSRFQRRDKSPSRCWMGGALLYLGNSATQPDGERFSVIRLAILDNAPQGRLRRSEVKVLLEPLLALGAAEIHPHSLIQILIGITRGH